MSSPAADLVQHWVASGVVPEGAEWVRFSGGNTNTLWQVADLVVKHYRAGAETPLFANDPKAEALALTALAGSGLAPDLVAAEAGSLVYRRVSGHGWTAADGVEIVAQALADLHAHPAPADLPHVPMGPVHLAQQTADLGGAVPPLPADLPEVARVFLHGDATAANALVDQSHVTFIDWQCPALGDPCDDIAVFLSPAMQAMSGNPPLSFEQIQAFLAAYSSETITTRYLALAPLYAARMRAYCLWRASRGDAGYAHAATWKSSQTGYPDPMKDRVYTPDAPHPFAPYVAILGRGKTKSRPFTFDEARHSMAMILQGEALPEQIGAYLMLLRLKEETPEEIAGFVAGTRDTFDISHMPQVDLDWSTYAGKRVQLPWFLLSVLTLVQSGVRVVMHGTEEHTPGRVYTNRVFEHFGLPIAGSFSEAAEQVETGGLTYIPLHIMSPVLRDLIELKPVLGLRSPVNSFTRLLNPFNAPTVMQGIFHRGFLDIHSGAARILDYQNAAVFRGDGGEIEMRPNKPCPVWTTHGPAEPEIETWPATLDDGHAPADEVMDVNRLADVWTGADEDAYAVKSVIGTLAVTLRTMGRAASAAEAWAQAEAMWAARGGDKLPLT